MERYPRRIVRDVALVHMQVDALRRLGDEAAALRCLKEALARREAVVGAATVGNSLGATGFWQLCRRR